MLLPLALACTLTARFKAVTKVFLGYATLVILAGLVVTVSRGAWLSTALSLLILFGALLFQRRYRLASLLVLIVLIAGGFWAAPKALVFQTRINSALPEAGSNNANLAALHLAGRRKNVARPSLVGSWPGPFQTSVSRLPAAGGGHQPASGPITII